jgi:kojibiose phosphorylase
VNTWQVHEDTFTANLKQVRSQETVFTIGNGYFCTRGTFEEGYPRHSAATLLYGVFDAVPIAKEELANAPDWTVIKLFVNGERFRLDRGKILDYHRTLDMESAVLSRTVHWESPNGSRVRITTERFASMADVHTGAIRYSVTADEDQPSEKPLTISLRATIDANQGNYDLMHWETADQGQTHELNWLLSETKKSDVKLAQVMSFTTSHTAFTKDVLNSDLAPSIRFRGQLNPGETLKAEKIVVMYTSRDDVKDPLSAAISHLEALLQYTRDEAKKYAQVVDAVYTNGASNGQPIYERLLVPHREEWQRYWSIADVILEGDDKAQLGLRYNVYQLRISVNPADPRYSIAAKGLTGFGYRGHVFHDTEIFMLPFFTYVLPDIARTLLMYRYNLLSAARQKASSHGYEGAQFPWESTLNGEEATPPSIIHPETGEVIPVLNGSIELHITSSIAHATSEYWRVTGDNDFLRDYGAELLLSTATFWASRAEKVGDHYEINNVIGPDEWHEHVHNNTYTNYMAKRNIQIALGALDWLQKHAPAKARELEQQLDLTEKRLDHWRDVADNIKILWNKETGLIEQFEGFFELPFLDQSKYKGRKDSYQAILGMSKVQQYQLIKQADVLMLLTVLDHEFDLKTKKANWDYYYPITDHDYGSSLTPALHVILGSELGQDEAEATYALFMKGALVDLENLRGNTPEGVHVACSGAVWQAAILGVAGLKIHDDGTYSTNPMWPDDWTRLAFHFVHKGELVHVDLKR